MKKKILLLISLFIITSCVSTRKIQKQHSSGSYISWHGKYKKKYTKHSLAN